MGIFWLQTATSHIWWWCPFIGTGTELELSSCPLWGELELNCRFILKRNFYNYGYLRHLLHILWNGIFFNHSSRDSIHFPRWDHHAVNSKCKILPALPPQSYGQKAGAMGPFYSEQCAEFYCPVLFNSALRPKLCITSSSWPDRG